MDFINLWHIKPPFYKLFIQFTKIQVFNNIFLNARQAMPSGGYITITAANTVLRDNEHYEVPDGNYIKIVINDQGIGIPKNILSRIFDPFFTTKQTCSGLGLTTTYSIIKRHNGHISINSEMGAGTTLTILLPAIKEGIEEEDAGPNRMPVSKGTILLMDDEEFILDVSSHILNKLGYETRCAKNGEDAIRMYSDYLEAGNKFSIVILDLTINCGMGGEQAIRKLLKIDPEVKALVSSGYSNDPILADPGKFGFSGIIAKPYKKDDLCMALDNVLKGPDNGQNRESGAFEYRCE